MIYETWLNFKCLLKGDLVWLGLLDVKAVSASIKVVVFRVVWVVVDSAVVSEGAKLLPRKLINTVLLIG